MFLIDSSHDRNLLQPPSFTLAAIDSGLYQNCRKSLPTLAFLYFLVYTFSSMKNKKIKRSEVCWEGDSRMVLKSFPEVVCDSLGFNVARVQEGKEPKDSRSMRTIDSKVFELRERDKNGCYRLVYAAKIEDKIYILHCFKKKSRKTSANDLKVAKDRLKLVYERIRKEKKMKAKSKPRSVFYDIYDDDPEKAAALELRAALYSEIEDVINKKGYTPRQLEKVLDVPQPRVSELLTGKIFTNKRVRVDTLLKYLYRLGRKVEIKTKARKEKVAA